MAKEQLDLFKDIVKSIQVTKREVINERNARVEFSFYRANIVMRALSYHKDCLYFVNEINQYPFIDPLMKYHFLLNIIRGGRRDFTPFSKVPKSDEIEAIAEYFNCSLMKAREYRRVLTSTQTEEIQKQVYKGGFSDGRAKRNGRGDAKAAR